MPDPAVEPAVEPVGDRVFARVAVTGHRPQHLDAGEAAWVQVQLARCAAHLREVYGTREGISGMALGADTWWALSVLAAGLNLAAYIPFEAQPATWPAVDRALWAHLRAAATREVLVGGTDYDVRMLHARNDAMLADADLVVAVYKPGTRGGTASAVAKATRSGLPMLLLDPTARTATRTNW